MSVERVVHAVIIEAHWQNLRLVSHRGIPLLHAHDISIHVLLYRLSLFGSKLPIIEREHLYLQQFGIFVVNSRIYGLLLVMIGLRFAA